MPKIVDHDAYRADLAKKAAGLFTKHGYSALGMRGIAAQLGISKSALYHYFPTKEALFEAATLAALSNIDALPPIAKENSTNDDGPADRKAQSAAVVAFARATQPLFADELSLIVDYLRGRTAQHIADNPAMVLANRHFRGRLAAIVGEAHADAALACLYGALLKNYFEGKADAFDDLGVLINALISSPPN